jgi:murein DD-endopeptidase MepM/ murein hydrolase activator NlpD
MTNQRPGVTVMIHRDGAVEGWSTRVPLWLVRFGGTAGIAIAVLMVLGAVLYAPIVRTALRVPGLEREIDRLEAQNQQVLELAANLQDAEARYEQVRTMLGGDIVPERANSREELPTAPPLLAHTPGRVTAFEAGASLPKHWPLDARWMITRGPTLSTDVDEAHSGLDIAVPRGTPIRAAGGGVVARAGVDAEYGRHVLIDHPENYQSLYGHASRVLVADGDTVRAGQVIGLTGSTGRSTAPHLHFEIRQSGRLVDPRSLVN